MRKLKLESLIVESFVTTGGPGHSRGTVQGHDQAGTGPTECQLCQISNDWRCQTDDPEVCGDTNYLDCTFACSDFPSCQAC